jgi:hypothetical protein
MRFPIAGSQVRAGAKIKPGLESKSRNGAGIAKSRQIDAVTSIARSLDIPLTLRSGTGIMGGGNDPGVSLNDSATKIRQIKV